MNQMRNMLRRLQALERLPQFQPPPSPLEQIRKLALDQMSHEDLEVIIHMVERDRGESQILLPSEVAALARRSAALETEARRMGFTSFADAERRAGRTR
jgi:hypothetical protein